MSYKNKPTKKLKQQTPINHKTESQKIYVASGNFTCWVNVPQNGVLEKEDDFLVEGATRAFEILFNDKNCKEGIDFCLTAINYETVSGIDVVTENIDKEDVMFADFVQLAFEDDRDNEEAWKFLSVKGILDNAGLGTRKFQKDSEEGLTSEDDMV